MSGRRLANGISFLIVSSAIFNLRIQVKTEAAGFKRRVQPIRIVARYNEEVGMFRKCPSCFKADPV
jgi:hypothetical protein